MATKPLVRDVLLRDGATLRLRAPTQADFAGIRAFYDDLSPRSRYLRFHATVASDAPARDYARADGVDRVVLIGHQGDRVVAAGGYDRLREPGAAELALAVADDLHGRGVATRMLEQLAALAAEQGIERFDAEVLAENRAMLGVFARAGFQLRRKRELGRVTASLDIRPSEAVEESIGRRDHLAAIASLRPILAPRSLAVVGDFADPRSLGSAVMANVLDGGFRGVAHAVSREGGIVRSMRAARSLGELDEAPDLVVIAVPADEVLEVAAEAGEHGARALVVLSAGFPDAGAEGDAREDRLLAVVRAAGLRMVGPNSLGVLNSDPSVALNATFAGARVPAGSLAVCSQSGALGISLLGRAAGRRLGVSSFASLGSRADVSTNDLLELWEEDARTAAVILYVETFGNPERFARTARRVARRKPILAVKGRRPEVTAGGPCSRTAAALGGDAAVDALLRSAGVLRIRTGEGLLNAAEFFASQPLPRGRAVGVVSNSAGLATLAHDALGPRGLRLAEPAVQDASPLSVGIRAGPDDYRRAVGALLGDDAVDAVMAFYVDLSGGDPRGVLAAVSEAAGSRTKPVVASVVDADGNLPEPMPGAVPNFFFPEACAGVLARGAEHREWLRRPLGLPLAREDLEPEAARQWVAARLERTGEGWLAPAEAEALLATYGIPVVRSQPAASAEEAVAAAAATGGPVALKAELPPPAVPGELGVVLLGLEGPVALRAGWHELERRVGAAGPEWRGAAVQPLMAPGADVLVGAVADPELGPVMAIGLGGRNAGLAADVAFRLPPATDVDADELLNASPSVANQLAGQAGNPALDREALRELVLRFAALLRAAPELVEADLNPVRCMVDGCAVLDSSLRLARRRPAERIRTW